MTAKGSELLSISQLKSSLNYKLINSWNVFTVCGKQIALREYTLPATTREDQSISYIRLASPISNAIGCLASIRGGYGKIGDNFAVEFDVSIRTEITSDNKIDITIQRSAYGYIPVNSIYRVLLLVFN